MITMNFIFGLSRQTKQFVSAVMDFALLSLACLMAMYVRTESIQWFFTYPGFYVGAVTVAAGLVLLVSLGIYKTVLRFSGVTLAQNIGLASIGTGVVLTLASYYFQANLPRTVPIIFVVVAWCSLTLPRFVLRTIYQRLQISSSVPVAIYGAGDAGRQVQLSLKRSKDLAPILFLDNNLVKQNTHIQDLKVYAPEDLPRLVQKYGIKKVILALPGVQRQTRSDILAFLESIEVEVLTIPNLSDLLTGKAKIDDVVHVDINDLLGRERVSPYKDLMKRHISKMTVLVTGAGGSIGSELCRQIVTQGPSQLIMFEKNEFALYNIDQELQQTIQKLHIDVTLIPILGSVQTYERLLGVFNRFGVDTVYHAAAYKHVPMVEKNVVEGIRNNVFGTYFAAKAAVSAGVKNFVLISTDKAVRPTNIMGATKRYAELVCQAFADNPKIKTRFAMVRFGNVLGSSGSVVPKFREQIAVGGPVTVTHKDITRYFMTIPEAAQLVIQAGAMSMGGEVYVLDMGEPVKIVDLAARMIRLSGQSLRSEATPEGSIEIKITGLRPGEKLYEELLVGDDVSGTEHERIMTANEMYLDMTELMENIKELEVLCADYAIEKIRTHMQRMPLEFFPVSPSNDLVGDSAEVVSLLVVKGLKA